MSSPRIRSRSLSLPGLLALSALAGCGGAATDEPALVTDDSETDADAEPEPSDDTSRPREGAVDPAKVGSFGPLESAATDPAAPKTCAAASQEAQLVTVDKEVTIEVPVEVQKPVAVYLMLDRSTSMVGVCGQGDACNPEGWNEATSAITEFLAAPASEDLDVGLGYFPPIDGNFTCDGAGCTQPAVAIGSVSDNAERILTSFAEAEPRADQRIFTPTECALRGATEFCAQHQADTGEPCVAVLVSDGAPTRCSEDTPDLADIAAKAHSESGVLTFTLGMTGADFGVLDAIAEAGGTHCDAARSGAACDVTAGQEAFIGALDSIRETVVVTETRTEVVQEVTSEVLDCEWAIPEMNDGTFDPVRVNVRLTPKDGDSYVLGHVDSKSACANSDDAWYYDDPFAPARVLACPSTCDRIEAETEARIDLEFGCATVPAVVR